MLRVVPALEQRDWQPLGLEVRKRAPSADKKTHGVYSCLSTTAGCARAMRAEG